MNDRLPQWPLPSPERQAEGGSVSLAAVAREVAAKAAAYRAATVPPVTRQDAAGVVAQRTPAQPRQQADEGRQIVEPVPAPAPMRSGPMTRRESKLVAASAQIAAEPPRGEDMAFTHAVLCQVSLPRSKVEGAYFMRRAGPAWVSVQAGVLDEGDGPVLQPIPYGAMPRLALAWVSTYAKRNNTREIPIGRSASEFLRLIGMESDGRRHARLHTQMHALAACRLQLGSKGRTFTSQPVEQFAAWLQDGDSPQKQQWPGVMVLSEGYYSSLVDSAVPLDNRALHALKGSALALDVYVWLAHRLHRIEGKGVVLHWKSLREQFAQEYKGKDADKDFRKAFLLALQAVLAVYPQAKVKPVTGGVMLIGSPPPVLKLTK